MSQDAEEEGENDERDTCKKRFASMKTIRPNEPARMIHRSEGRLQYREADGATAETGGASVVVVVASGVVVDGATGTSNETF